MIYLWNKFWWVFLLIAGVGIYFAFTMEVYAGYGLMLRSLLTAVSAVVFGSRLAFLYDRWQWGKKFKIATYCLNNQIGSVGDNADLQSRAISWFEERKIPIPKINIKNN